VISNDELTGVQALERKHPGLPLRPGKVERREFEYMRHGTLCFIVNFEVATGQIGQVSCGPTRTEQDFLNHIEATVAADRLSAAGTLLLIILTPINPRVWFVLSRLNLTWLKPSWGSKENPVF
jgi:hypothetical protein